MSSEQQEAKGKQVTSDESNSTEHDVTVSLSGTDEMNDAHSVFSDSISLASKASKPLDHRKAVHKLAKLKEENMLLREALEKANASDITMLKTRLRGTNADLVRVRQNNMELKDRIQILESRLFSALSSKNAKGGDSVADLVPTVQPPLETSTITDSKFTSSERAQLMDTIKSLQSRCKHLSRLVQSYETKISQLEAERTAPQSEHNPTIGFNIIDEEGSVNTHTNSGDTTMIKQQAAPLKSALKSSTGQISNGSNDRKAVRHRRDHPPESEIDARIQKARETDVKMIRELSAEVKRLVALLPRSAIEETKEENMQQHSSEGTGDAVEETQHSSAAARDPLPPASPANGNLKSGSLDSQPAPTSSTQDGGYTPGQVLASFVAGVLVMLLCFALSGRHLLFMGQPAPVAR